MKKYKYYKYNPKYGIPTFFIKAISLNHATNRAIQRCNQLHIPFYSDQLKPTAKTSYQPSPNKIKYKNQ